MDLYTYCLAEELDDTAIESVAGVGGCAPQLIHYNGITAVTSAFAGSRVELTRENVYGHERVVSLVTTMTSPLPFRFGTVVTAAQLEKYVQTNKGSLIGLLARVRGSVEMSVKILRRTEPTGEVIEPEFDARADESPGAGTRFLTDKRREIAKGETARQQAEETAAWLRERVGGSVRDSVVRLNPSEGLAIAAAHLVERARMRDYLERLSAAQGERTGLHFLTSGPWPPYSFADLQSIASLVTK